MARETTFSIDNLLGYKCQLAAVIVLFAVVFFHLEPSSRSSAFLLYASTVGLFSITAANSIYVFNEYYRRSIFTRGQKFNIAQDDVVLIVGGSRGLGLEVSKQFLTRATDVTVCVIDIHQFNIQEELSSIMASNGTAKETRDKVHFFECNAEDQKLLLSVIKYIETNIGRITILINNVGIKHNETFSELSYSKIRSIFSINLFSYITTTKLLLKLRTEETTSHNKKLFIVNVSSVLGIISPSHLSIYSATKAAIIALHESLIHEYRQISKSSGAQIGFLLVKLGQLDTLLFDDVKPPRPFLAPVLSHKKVAKIIFERIRNNEVGEMTVPLYGKFVAVLKILPFFLVEWLRAFSEVDNSVPDVEKPRSTDSAVEKNEIEVLATYGSKQNSVASISTRDGRDSGVVVLHDKNLDFYSNNQYDNGVSKTTSERVVTSAINKLFGDVL